jgi:hypothetical protein
MLMAWWQDPFVHIPLISPTLKHTGADFNATASSIPSKPNFIIRKNGTKLFFENLSTTISLTAALGGTASIRQIAPELETHPPDDVLTVEEQFSTKRKLNLRSLGKVTRYFWSRRFLYLHSSLQVFSDLTASFLSIMD